MITNIIARIRHCAIHPALLCTLVTTALLFNGGCKDNTDSRTGIPYNEPNIVFEGNSKKLEKTILISTLNSPIPKNNNIIWCSSFQLAWNELKNDIIKEDIILKDAQDATDRLNLSNVSTSDILNKSYYSAAGFVNDGIVEKIQKEMSNRFPSIDKPVFSNLSNNLIIAYSYLEASVKFNIPYFENHKDFIFTDSQGNQTKISSFGIRDEDRDVAYFKLREQIDILYLKQDNFALIDYAIDLCKYTNPYQIVLAKIKPGDTLMDTFNNLQNSIDNFHNNEDLDKFGPNDTLLIPNIFFDITGHFNELEGKYFGNHQYTDYYIDRAIQQIRFKLDRSGAELKSEATIIAGCEPNHFNFDQPFLIYIKKRTAKNPIFVMWVDNAELLAKPAPHKAKTK